MEREKILLKPMPEWQESLEQYFKNEPFCILNSNGSGDDYELIVAAGSIDELIIKHEENPFEKLREFHQKHKDWIFWLPELRPEKQFGKVIFQ
ncbi:MAG: hypothetical protein H0X62_03145 [Bacteroidetes bacterium]|nr:hypothetical protein [Bacteroidota bacterium]